MKLVSTFFDLNEGYKRLIVELKLWINQNKFKNNQVDGLFSLYGLVGVIILATFNPIVSPSKPTPPAGSRVTSQYLTIGILLPLNQ